MYVHSFTFGIIYISTYLHTYTTLLVTMIIHELGVPSLTNENIMECRSERWPDVFPSLDV